MRLGIDASNLRAGGGVTHLLEILRHGCPPAHGFEQVCVWGPRSTLDALDPQPWLHRIHLPVFERHYVVRALWQRGQLGAAARTAGCDLLFVPGGSFATSFRPVVTMSRNMLPFEPKECARYGITAYRFKLALLRQTQSRSLRRADGRIFLSDYARRTIEKVAGPFDGRTVNIPHGVEDRFTRAPRPARSLAQCSEQAPLQLLYVSTIDVYKHQAAVAKAVARLRAEGRPLTLDLVGGAYPPALRSLRAALEALDPEGAFLRYHGAVNYRQLDLRYAEADVAVFASSCENMPNTLVEMMAAGLPIACSRRGPMPEVLGDAGVYFDPESVDSIALALRQLVDDPHQRAAVAAAAAARARRYSWQRCAEATFDFLREVAIAQPKPAGRARATA